MSNTITNSDRQARNDAIFTIIVVLILAGLATWFNANWQSAWSIIGTFSGWSIGSWLLIFLTAKLFR